MAYGLAFDVGTTTLAGSLVDLASGERRAVSGSLNPQMRYGTDVITRLEYACRSEANLKQLSSLLNAELERLATALVEEAGRGGALDRVAFAGNPAMEHLLLGLPVDSLARIPYRPLFTAGRIVSTSSLGWKRQVDSYLFPLPGAFVGGDLVAFLLGRGMIGSGQTAPPRLFLDLGTNGEIALAAGGTIHATSAAAGPALEGGNLSCGMAALPGAIDSVKVDRDTVAVTTIGGLPPAGICGSAVVEAVAGMLNSGVVDLSGRILPPSEIPTNLGGRIRDVGEQPAFVLYHDATRMIALTQEDVRQVQLAKAAVRAGMEVLAKWASLSWHSLEGVVLTGSFGNHLRPDHLVTIGLLPEGMAERTLLVQEGALAGVEALLGSRNGCDRADRLAEGCRVVPLSGNPAFEAEFLRHMNFPRNGGER